MRLSAITRNAVVPLDGIFEWQRSVAIAKLFNFRFRSEAGLERNPVLEFHDS